MKIKKNHLAKFFTFTLSLLMVVVALPFTSFAEGVEPAAVQEHNVTFTTDGNGTLTSGGNEIDSPTETYQNETLLLTNTYVAGLTPVANEGYSFTHWTYRVGDTDYQVNTLPSNLKVTQDITFTAVFTAQHTVTFTTDGNGTLTETITTGIISKDYSYVDGSLLIHNTFVAGLKPVANDGYTFLHWEYSVDGITKQVETLPKDLEVTQGMTFTAKFLADKYIVNFVAGENGSLTTNNIEFFKDTTHQYDHGTLLLNNTYVPTLEPVADEGYTFSHWEYVNNGVTKITSELPKEFAVTSPNTFTAIFTAVHNLTFTTDGNGTLENTTGVLNYTLPETTLILTNTVVDFPTPVAKSGYEFASWTFVYLDTEYTITGSTKQDIAAALGHDLSILHDITLTANFKQVQTVSQLFTVTVNRYNQDTNELIDSQVIATGNTGTYDVPDAYLSHNDLVYVSHTGDLNGSFGSENIVINIYFTAEVVTDETTGTTPETEETTGTDENEDVLDNEVPLAPPPTNEEDEEEILDEETPLAVPATNDNGNSSGLFAISGITSLLALVFVKFLKSKKEEA